MSATAWLVVGASAVALLTVLVLGRRIGWIRLNLLGKTGFAAAQARGRASAEDAKAGGSIVVRSGVHGAASADRSQAGGDISVTSGPGGS